MSKIIASNHKAYRDYEIIETIECGIELKGSEVKSIRQGNINLSDSFAHPEGSGIILYNTHISPYLEASYLNVEPTRPRKLLLHKKQIERLVAKLTQRGLTLVPLKVYFNDRGFVKIELGLGKGKRLYDKREDIKRRELDLGMRRILKVRRGK
ncbi:MAG: SsrA-binding protein [Candidatus Omnitrophica bacterium CG08_land_8_20_14_0_20_41_16]|uniref:SsrA-binding protein n=1 Tax=Candidatus Sherwoodlollariibacterium unditelluris TaxID=1974757 RepID=A0A2G9YJJ1_9BACT|nr:MAG: SsrA-binding protein [Candidatus Omnitrophica bacterium CG23_combo_of_CG06-09_8_20_14_all_41_10]PIS33847.1 MAG: SsrA-binding protein [Candidatus Omnitrophica bacterium CG08_land_8_20_14_0_20_41_16]